ncbi:MAG: hypothetical protein N0A00_01500 [Candidatus Bathyarchaeota archaeon]|nr:hypothetical protein [Candidatus Bathyarchaeota archaeon]
MREIVFSFEEFKAKVDSSKPIHHCFYSKTLDNHGIFHRLEFWITGVSKDANRIIAFYAERRSTIGEREADQKWMDEMVERFAKPIGSTEGEWR